MRDDHLQGILFSSNNKVILPARQSSLKKVTIFIFPFLDKISIKKHKKTYQPIFSTNLLPRKTVTHTTDAGPNTSNKTHIVLR